jgi:predicted Zn-dependent protease with MMP-like domain
MDPKAFEKLVLRAFRSIPEKFRSRMDNVAVCVDDACLDDPDLLGLYEGVALTERGPDVSGMLPDTITLYRKTILEEAEETDGDVYRVVRETLIHELAHHFGWDDDMIHEVFEARWEKENGA